MDLELLIRFAGVGLALIAVANLIVPRMLDYAGNLARVDRMFGQVFRVHAAYTVVTVAGMAILCLWRPDFFLTDGVARVFAYSWGFTGAAVFCSRWSTMTDESGGSSGHGMLPSALGSSASGPVS